MKERYVKMFTDEDLSKSDLPQSIDEKACTTLSAQYETTEVTT